MDIQHMAGAINHGRGVTAIVLENFQSISLARKHLWAWEQIASALREQYPEQSGLSRGAVRMSFTRIERGIKARRIKPVGSQRAAAQAPDSIKTAPEKKVEQPKTKRPFHRVGETTPATEDDGLTEAERIINSLHHI